jgi:hypothetical protein
MRRRSEHGERKSGQRFDVDSMYQVEIVAVAEAVRCKKWRESR